MNNDYIVSIRESEFRKMQNNYALYEKTLINIFKYMSAACADGLFAYSILLLFEYALLNNFIATNRVITKCEIIKRLRAQDNASRAIQLLDEIYNVRNACAHNSVSLMLRTKRLKRTIETVTSYDQMGKILSCIMPTEYPDCLNNIYYLVKRDVDNPNYIKLKEDMFTELKLPNKTVKQVLDKFNSEVNESIRNQALLEVLSNYGLTDEEKQEA